MRRILYGMVGVLGCLATLAHAGQTPSPALLVLNKADTSLAIVDPSTLAVVARVFAGQDPHEVIASADGKLAFVSNYGGFGEGFHTLSVIDLVAQKPLPAVDLSPLRSPHGLAMADGKIYFTAEANKVIGRYDPATQKIDWILGLGQNRTHMIVVTKDAKHIFTSNVNSDTISIIEHSTGAAGGFAGPGGPGTRPSDSRGPGDGGGFPPGPPGDPNSGPPDFNGPPPNFGGNGNGPPPFPPGGPGRNPNEWSVTNVKVGKGPEGFDLSPDGTQVWAANSHDGTISVIDVQSKAVTGTLHIPTRMANRLKFTLDGKRVFVSDLGGRGVVIIDAATRKEIQRITLGRGAAGILMQPDGARAYVASGNGVSVIDCNSLKVVGRVETGRGPDGLGWAVRP